jgi:cyclic di-GMP phosphodiesterase
LIAERTRADQSTRQLRTAREMVLYALTSLTETRDFETGAHLVRTSRYARVLGEALASHPKFRGFLTPETIDLIARLAPIHDIGKVGVADRIAPEAWIPDGRRAG